MAFPNERGASLPAAPLQSIHRQANEQPLNSQAELSFESGLTAGEAAVLERIREAARAGASAPTTDEIAELLDCASLSTPVAALRRLQLRGLIYFESYQKSRRFWLPDGRSTAPVSCTDAPWRWRREAAHG
jgi:hypothetical protein